MHIIPAPVAPGVACLFVLMGAMLSGAGDARAEPNPYSIGVRQAFGHDTNLFRSENDPIPDKYSVTSLIVGFDQPVGRQRFYANGSVGVTRYEDIKQLNHTGYNLNAGVDWSTIERISGDLKVLLNQSLAQYGASVNQPQLDSKNIENAQQISGRLQWGLASLLSLDGMLTHRRVDFSAPEFAESEYSQNSGSLGLTYRPSGLLTLGVALRATRGEYPNIVLANGDTATFERNDLDLTATWVASGLSTINSRLSFGKRTSDALSQRDFSGATGSISWAYLPTGKLSFNTSLSRDTGTESAFADIGANQVAVNGAGDNSRTTTTFALTGGWEATAKIRVNVSYRYSRRSLVEEQLVNGAVVQTGEGRDSLSTYSLGATYMPSRSLQFGCNAARRDRRASGGLSTGYEANITTCSAQFTLQ